MTDTYGGSPTGPSGPGEYPATFRFDPPDHIANWRPLVHWLLVIPHGIIVYALSIVSEVVAIISWFAILITGGLPEGLANFQALYLRYYLRTLTFLGFMREEYPPFAFATTPADPGDDPRVRVDVQPQLTDRNRLTTAFRIILVIPHMIVVALLGLAVSIVGIIAGFVVLFTGHWPEGLRAFVLGAGRWWLRVQAYWLLLNDEYPPFAFDDLGGTAPQAVSSPPPAPA